MENMNGITSGAILAMGMGQPTPGHEPSTYEKLTPMVFMVALFAVMYVIMIRPQRLRQKQLETLLKSIRPGDKVLTGSGIVGVILTVKEKTVTLRSADTKLEVLKSAISEVTERGGESAASETAKN
jgi:preprotein translocase subunit YajC